MPFTGGNRPALLEEHDMESQAQFGDVTEQVQAQSEKPASNHLELQLVHHGQGEYRLPFITPTIELWEVAAAAFSPEERWVATLIEDGVELEDRGRGLLHRLAVGDRIEIEGNSFCLVDARRPPLGTLEGLSEPYIGRSWHIRAQKTFLGRAGKRINHIELAHPTVSRTHATFLPDGHGGLFLLNETAAAATTVNGESVDRGKQHRLAHGDLIAFGDQLFRYASSSGASGSEALLTLTTLGTFLVGLGAESNLETRIKQKKAGWLLALLGTQWGKPVSVESIIDKLWPDVVVLRGRKNLSALLSHLQSALELDDEAFNNLLVRTPASLQLNPERLGVHDFTEVEKLTQAGAPLTSEVALERLLGLYQGGFLPGCYDDWAETLRQNLETGFVSTLRATAEEASASQRFELVEKACAGLLALDPCDEEAAELWSEVARRQGREDRAEKIEEDLRAALEREGL